MIKTLSFTDTTNPIKLPSITEDPKNGVKLQLWIRRTGNTARQCIIELGNDSGQTVVLGTGDDPDDLILSFEQGTSRKELVVQGALPQYRWVQVKVTVGVLGTGTVSLFGTQTKQALLGTLASEPLTRFSVGGGAAHPFVGNLSQLDVSVITDLATNTVTPWASYPLTEAVLDHTEQAASGPVDCFRVDDAGPNNRDGLVMGGVATAEFRNLSQDPDPVLELDGTAHLRLSAIRLRKGAVTLEAWVCPKSTSQSQVLLHIGNGQQVRLLLSVGGSKQEIALVLAINGDAYTLCKADYALTPGVFTHIAATVKLWKTAEQTTLGPISYNKAAFAIYKQGQLAASSNSLQKWNELDELLREPHLPVVKITGQAPGMSMFAGQVSEVRIWDEEQGAQAIGSRFLSRVSGKEDTLAACYRLEEAPSGYVYDISAARGLGQISSGARIVTSTALPLLPTRGDVYLDVKGKLATETILTRTSENPLTVSPVETTVFDATFEARQQSTGTALGGATLHVMADESVTFFVQEKDYFIKKSVAADSVQHILLPASGKIRLRFLAKDMTFPTLRAYVDGMAAGVWTIVRPDRAPLTAMASLKAGDLRQPASGKSSPLPANCTMDDAVLCAGVLNRLAAVYGPPVTLPVTSPRPELRLSWSDISSAASSVINTLDSTADTVVKTLSKAGEEARSLSEALLDDGKVQLSKASSAVKSASNLITDGVGSLSDLIVASAKAAQRYGQQSIETCIARADRMAIIVKTASNELAHTFSIIGTSIIDGSTVVWRVVCAGVRDAFTAVKAFLLKIGAAIQKVIEYLAWLFNWHAFVVASDEIYADMKEYLAAVPGVINGLGSYRSQLNQYLSLPSDIGDQTIAQLFHLSVPSIPSVDELEYAMELMQSVFDSKDFGVDGSSQMMKSLADAATGLDLATIQSSLRTEPNALMDLFSNPTGILTTPLQGMLNTMMTGSSSTTIVDFLYGLLTSSVTTALNGITELLTAHISIPGLTSMIEALMEDRSLNLLRMAAFIAAVCKVLTIKVKSTIEGQSGKAISFADQGQTNAAACSFAFGLIFAALEGLRAKVEYAVSGVSVGKAFIDVLLGVVFMGRAGCSYQMNKKQPAAAQDVLMAQSTIELFSGLSQTILSAVIVQTDSAAVAKLNCGIQSALAAASIVDIAWAAKQGVFSSDLEWSSFGFQSGGILLSQLAAVVGVVSDHSSRGKVGPRAQVALAVMIAACGLAMATLEFASSN